MWPTAVVCGGFGKPTLNVLEENLHFRRIREGYVHVLAMALGKEEIFSLFKTLKIANHKLRLLNLGSKFIPNV